MQIGGVWGQSNVSVAIRENLIGSPASVWLTGSMLIFLISGELYHRSWQRRGGPDPRLIQLGDLVSGIAAVALTVALVWLGDAAIALFAGLLLAGGKLGSAVLPTFDLPRQGLAERVFRSTVLASRVPSIIALAVTIVRGGDAPQEVILSAIIILCFFLWLWADLLLLWNGRVVLMDRNNSER